MRDYLEHYNAYIAKIQANKHLIKKLEKEEASISSPNLSVNGDIKPKGFVSSNTENKVIKKQDKIVILEKQISELQSKVDMVDNLISTLRPEHQKIINMRYKENLIVEDIAQKLKREQPSVSRTITMCIKKMEKSLNVMKLV